MPANVATLQSIAGPTAPAAPPTKSISDDSSGFVDHLDRAQKAATTPSRPAKADDQTAKAQTTEAKPGKAVGSAKGGANGKGKADAGDAESMSNVTADVKVDRRAGDALANDSGGSPQPQPEGKAKPSSTEHPAKVETPAVNPAAVVGLSSVPTPTVAPAAIKTAVTEGVTSVNPAVIESGGNSPSAPIPTAEANAKAQATAAAFDATTAKPQAAGHDRVATVSPLDNPSAADVKGGANVKPPATVPTLPSASTDAPPADAAVAVSADALVGAIGKHAETPDTGSAHEGLLAQGATTTLTQNSSHAPTAAAQSAPIPPEARFTEANHASIVNSVQTNLLPHGGSMLIRLDPPELGALQVSVEMRNGTMNATFQTSNEAATQLLSHSLGQLKTALESQGVTVDKIQVQQAPRDTSSQNHGEGSPQQLQDEAAARQDQQRKQMLRQMWRKVSGVADPVDMVA